MKNIKIKQNMLEHGSIYTHIIAQSAKYAKNSKQEPSYANMNK